MTLPAPGEREIFDVARQLAPHERGPFLDRSCGDDRRLRARVEALLEVHDRDSGFLENPTQTSALDFQEPTGVAPGDTIGPYKLLERLGEGGMGEVFRAEQTAPVEREVALKIVKPGMDTRQVLARFNAERQALALMDHPNIAKVFDAGVSSIGRPYFAMELIRGVPITEFCDQRQLTPRRRLELFVAVCQAVQHAHQKGVIHRDLKPSNVLVTIYDGNPVPKIIDFGIAKATGPRFAERTFETALGAIVGTLEYMSPEQAEPDQHDIDTRSDIYSLGVLLYELLTGTTPLERKHYQQAAWFELLRIVRESEPPKPSARLSTTEGLPSIAANRGVEPKTLSGLVRGDLDWIVMKTLEKDRARRYETASGLALDIQRYLTDQPVEAIPPSSTYKLRKFYRRNRTLLAAATAFAALLLVGIVVSTWQAVRATVAEGRARENETKAVAEMHRADDEADIAKSVNEFLLDDLISQAYVGNQPTGAPRNKDLTVREVLDRAANGIGVKFKGKERIEGAIRTTIGKAYEGLGDFDRAIQHLERARELLEGKMGASHPGTIDCINSIGLTNFRRGRYAEAAQHIERALALGKQTYGDNDANTIAMTQNLGGIYQHLGRFEQAEAMLKSVLEIARAKLGEDDRDTLLATNSLGCLYLSKGRFAEAEPLLKKAIDGFRNKLAADHPFTLTCSNNLAGCYMRLGRLEDAQKLYERTLEVQRVKLGDQNPETLMSINNLAIVLNMRQLRPEAERLFQEVLKTRRLKLGVDHPETLRTLNGLAMVYRDMGRMDDAERHWVEACTRALAKLGASHPQTRLYIGNLAALYDKQTKPAQAAQWRQKLSPPSP